MEWREQRNSDWDHTLEPLVHVTKLARQLAEKLPAAA
jgi:hypothetical protein